MAQSERFPLTSCACQCHPGVSVHYRSVIMIRFVSALITGITLTTAGCGKNPHRLAPVSGKVTMDGNPLANATVAFLPDTKPGAMPSPTSRGETDQNGRYTLTSSEDKPGAVVGMSKVRISTMKSTGGSEGEGGALLARETVPERYNARTELTFDVPEEGTEAADFALKSK